MGRILPILLGVILIVPPVLMVLRMRSRYAQHFTIQAFAKLWREASPEIRAAVVFVSIRYLGSFLFGLALIIGAFRIGAAIPLMTVGLVFYVGSVILGWVWRGWSKILRSRP